MLAYFTVLSLNQNLAPHDSPSEPLCLRRCRDSVDYHRQSSPTSGQKMDCDKSREVASVGSLCEVPGTTYRFQIVKFKSSPPISLEQVIHSQNAVFYLLLTILFLSVVLSSLLENLLLSCNQMKIDFLPLYE